ncbi:hypothetical protein D3C73_1671640 [compost metagenome]
MVTHIDKQRIRIVNHLVNAIGLQILTDVRRVEALVIEAVGNDAFTHFQAQHPEGFSIVFQGDI